MLAALKSGEANQECAFNFLDNNHQELFITYFIEQAIKPEPDQPRQRSSSIFNSRSSLFNRESITNRESIDLGTSQKRTTPIFSVFRSFTSSKKTLTPEEQLNNYIDQKGTMFSEEQKNNIKQNYASKETTNSETFSHRNPMSKPK
jgi:hypothetical protein